MDDHKQRTHSLSHLGFRIMELAGKVALVTGGSGGIGSEIARHLSRMGAQIVIHYGGNKSAADAVVAEIAAAGGNAIAIQADFGSLSELRSLFAAADDAFSRLDILVNNAGVAMQRLIADVAEEEYDRLWALNTKAYFFCMQEAAKRLPNGGRIINIGSGAAYSNRAATSIYAASRAAIQSYTRVASVELGARGITVNSVSPGPVSPGVFDELPPEMQERVRAMAVLGRIGTPDDIAGIVGFLACDAARWITGQDILATGGVRP